MPATKSDEPKTAAEKKGDLEPAKVAVPQVNEEGEQVAPAVSDELELSDDVNDNLALGTKTAEEVWPEGATPIAVPEDLPLYPRETVSETKTYGDVTWWKTSLGRWLTTKGVGSMATTVTHGPDEPPPDQEELNKRNEKAVEIQAEMVAAGEKQIAEEQAELSAEANEAREERNAERAKAQAEQQEKVDKELEEAVVALEVREPKEVREVEAKKKEG